MSFAWLVALAVLFMAYNIRKSLRHIHMMQQNSYLNSRYFRWFSSRLKKHGIHALDLREAALSAAVILIFAGDSLLSFIALAFTAAAYILLTVFYKKGRAAEKKPLVMTNRAKRLYGVNIFLLLALAAVIIILKTDLFIAVPIFVAATWFSSVFAVAANSLLIPVERVVNKRFMNDAAKILSEMPYLTVVGVTGSYGKTSTKFILGNILNEKYMTLVSPESYNTPMGLTRMVREMLKPTHEMMVAEMGARQKGDIEELCDLVKPRAGIITAVGEQHLETFKNLETIIKTKFELMTALPADGTLVVNADDKNIQEGLKIAHQCNVLGCSFAGNGDYNISSVKASSKGSSFIISAPLGESLQFSTLLLGRHNIMNITCAVALAHQLGVPFSQAAQAVRRLQPVPHRLSLITTPQGLNIIDDAFNSNPVGAKYALEVLASFDSGRRILITPGMIELGESQVQFNAQFALAASQICDYIILVGAAQTKPLADCLHEAAFPDENLCVARDLAAAREQMIKWAVPGDTILFENDLPDAYNE